MTNPDQLENRECNIKKQSLLMVTAVFKCFGLRSTSHSRIMKDWCWRDGRLPEDQGSIPTIHMISHSCLELSENLTYSSGLLWALHAHCEQTYMYIKLKQILRNQKYYLLRWIIITSFTVSKIKSENFKMCNYSTKIIIHLLDASINIS